MQQGDVIADRFELVRLAGVGGMGEVWQSRDRVSGEITALKLLTGTSESARASFGREALILAELGHPGIVRYVAHGITPAQHPYLVMEWLQGEDLAQRLEQGRLTVDEVVVMLGQVAEALALAHGRGVVHRDIKPSNLYLCEGSVERVKLLDFGIAMPSAGARRRMMRGGATVGTPAFMSPEQARGDEDIDARADMFALGCVAFECLTGRRAFEGEHAMAVFSKILLEDVPHVADVVPEVPAAVDRLVYRMLSKEREHRPRDGAELVEVLRQAGQRTSLVPPGSGLTRSEQRVLGVVLVAPAPLGTSIPPPDGVRASVMPDLDAQRVHAIVQERGAQLEHLADGSLLLVMTRKGGVGDLAVQIAQCALDVRAALSARRMALAIVRGDADAGPATAAVDRAAQLLLEDRARSQAERIIVDEATAALLDARFELERGEGYAALQRERLLDEGARTLLGKPTECVGRDRELASLEAIVRESASESVARAVLVTAPAGAGKSRVRSELIARIRRRADADAPPEKGAGPGRVEIWFARGDPMRTGSPFGLAAQLLRHACGIAESEPVPQQQARLTARVALHVKQEPVRVAQFLAELIGAPFADEDSPQLRAARQDPMLLGDQIRRAWEDFVRAESAAAPIVLVLEDLQWGDVPTVKLMDAALRSLSLQPVTVLAFARSEVHERFPGLWAEREAREVRLPALTRKASARLIRNALGDSVGDDLVQRIVERAEGNAFYLEELIRTVAEGSDKLPDTIVGMVEARLERLDPAARLILRAASVFGMTFWRGGAASLLGEARGLDDWITHLIEGEILTKRSAAKFADETEYAFRQAVLRDGAYAMLTTEDRTLGHRLAGDWLDHSGERDAMVVAEHYELGDSRDRALVFYPRAAEQALEGNDLEGVIARVQRAVACGAQGDTLGALRCIEAEADNWRGENADGHARALEAMSLLEAGTASWYAAAREGIITAGKLGRKDHIDAVVDLLRAQTAKPGAVNARRMALAWAAMFILFMGSYFEADSLLAELARTEKLNESPDPRVEAVVTKARGVSAAIQRDLERAYDLMSTALARFVEAGDLRNASNLRVDVGIVALELGAFEAAEATIRSGLREAEQMALHAGVADTKLYLGTALMRLHRHDEARAALMDAYTGSVAQMPNKAGVAQTVLAMLQIETKQLAEAELAARHAAELLRDMPEQAPALAVLARALLRMDRPTEALASAEEAMAILRRFGTLEGGESIVRLAYAEALVRAGDQRAADAIEDAHESVQARAAAIADAQRRTTFLERIEEHSSILALAGSPPRSL